MHTDIALLNIGETSCSQETEADKGDLKALVEAMRQRVVQGLIDAHVHADKNAGKAPEIAPFAMH